MMEITVMVLEQTTELNGHKNAKGVAEQFGEEIQWEAWKGRPMTLIENDMKYFFRQHLA
jgi:hypothetical protein